MNTYFGYKHNMTQVFAQTGVRLPVTKIGVKPMKVMGMRNLNKDGYTALIVELSDGNKKEIRLDSEITNQIGDNITVDQVLKTGDKVKISGVTKGKGFSGPMVRWGFKGGPKTHGQSDRARAPGAIGQGTSPGRVHKGKKMAGHFGNDTFTVKNLRVVKIDIENQEVWVTGAVPGHNHTLLSLQVTGSGDVVKLDKDDQVKKDGV